MNMHAQESDLISGDKQYFYDRVASVRKKLEGLPAGSFIKKYFPLSRLDEIKKKIDCAVKESDLQYWQPLFTVLSLESRNSLNALDDDLSAIVKHRHNTEPEEKICNFLRDLSDYAGDRSWWAGVFEVYVKATLIGCENFSVEALDWLLPNGRDMDVRVSTGTRKFGLECTSLGESDANKAVWREHHASSLRGQALVQRSDPYSPGRRLYQKLYSEKLARDFDLSQSQFSQDSPNLLLIEMSSSEPNLSPERPFIGWALDELFSKQSTENTSPVSLKNYLLRKLTKDGTSGSSVERLEYLLRAPSQISGILLFSGCELKHARININARECCRMSYDEMVLFEKALSRKPAYVNS